MSHTTISPFPEDLSNQILNADFFEVWKKVPDNSLDLICTSPPYFNAREYSHWEKYSEYRDWLFLVFKELYRTLRPGRRICWQVCDYASDDRLAKTSYAYPIASDSIQAALDAGMRLRHWVIWEDPASAGRFHPTGSFPHGPSVIVKHTIEFIIVLIKPKSQAKGPNPNGIDVPINDDERIYNEMGRSFFRRYVSNQIWNIPRQTQMRDLHPAPFPEALIEPCIRMWSRPGEIVADPFMGSGTTAISALLWRRKYFGSEIHEKYWRFAQKRIADRELLIATQQFTLPFVDMLKSDAYTPNEIKVKQQELMK